MNERIKELVEQQGLTGPNYLISSQELEKFAELIVRECLEQVRFEVQYEYDFGLAVSVSERVLEHFGVE